MVILYKILDETGKPLASQEAKCNYRTISGNNANSIKAGSVSLIFGNNNQFFSINTTKRPKKALNKAKINSIGIATRYPTYL